MKLILPRDILEWSRTFKEDLSMSLFIIRCMNYIKENNITLDQLKQREQLDHERIKNTHNKREG